MFLLYFELPTMIEYPFMNITKLQSIGIALWVSVILIWSITIWVLAKDDDQTVCNDNLCLYNSWMASLSVLWKEVALLKNESDILKSQFEKKEKEYNKKLKKYNDMQLQVNWYIISTGSKDIKDIQYQAEFMRYLDYDVPEYDWNATWYVVFIPGTSYEKTRMMNIAYQLWWEDFVLTLHAENQRRDPTKQSDCHWRKCEGPESWKKREESYWYCQLNVGSYREFIESKYFADPEAQIIKCRNEFKRAIDNWNIETKFYWYNKRSLYAERFTFIKR